MDKLIRIGSVIALCMLTVLAPAQEKVPASGDFMESDGKIYVVLAVVVTIVLGIFLYLLNLDRKMTKMEKRG
ncbi:MAG: CcmD family protein [Chitinophagaceae bacterium]|jgi:CcmD family protein|nr:CcmD family protein [Chitinophagaceae bacterium]